MKTLSQIKIYLDADACPVRKEAEKIAERFGVKLVVVSNGGIRPSRDEMIETIIVAKGADAADDWIEEHIKPNDIVVTQDILLADRCLKKQVIAIGPNGKEFNQANIGMILGMRELNQHLRETGMGASYNKPFDAKDRSRFLQNMDLLLRQAMAK